MLELLCRDISEQRRRCPFSDGYHGEHGPRRLRSSVLVGVSLETGYIFLFVVLFEERIIKCKYLVCSRLPDMTASGAVCMGKGIRRNTERGVCPDAQQLTIASRACSSTWSK